MPTSPQLPSPQSRAIVTTEIVEMGGAERSTLALARWLYEHNIPAHLVCYVDNVGLERFASHPVTVVQLKPKMSALPKIRALGSYLRSRSVAPASLLSGYQTALHAAAANIHGFHTLMHDTPSLFSGATETASFKSRIARSVSDRITAHGLRSGGNTIVTSEYLRDETRRVFGVEAAIARMGGLAARHTFRPRPVGNQLRMLSVSRIESNKRIDWLLRAFATLEGRKRPISADIDWHFDIAGKGTQLPALQALSHQLGLDGRVHFQGFVTDEQLQQLYNTADLFLMPAVQGYGIPAIESLQRGIPVLLHRDSGVSDILLGTPWATVFEGGEPALAPALEHSMQSVQQGRQVQTPPPPIPTEDQWAEQVARLCHWL